jgi:hypothetical protein
LTLTLRSLGFNTFQSNLLTIPASALLVLQLLLWTRLSEWRSHKNNRFAIVLLCQLWMLPLLVALEVLPGGTSNAWARYAVLVLAVGYPFVHAILVALTSRNAGSVRTRTVGSALYNMSVQASSIVASNVYLDDDKPLYRRGNKVLIGITVYTIVLIGAIKLYYIWRNRRKEGIWNKMSEDERRRYLETTTDEGNKRLDFRFAH